MNAIVESRPFPTPPAFVLKSIRPVVTGQGCGTPGWGGSQCDPRLMCSPEERARQMAQAMGGNACERTVLPHSTAAAADIAAGAANQQIVLVCQIRICPDKFVVSPSIAAFFAIDDILFGNERVLGGAARVGADQFSPDSTFPLKSICLYPGMNVTVEVTNLDAGNPHPFLSAFSGPQLRGY